MKHALLLLVCLISFNTSADNSALTRVCAFRFVNPSYLSDCTKLANDFAKIAKLQQRMYQPQSAEWNPNIPFFETPTVYWVQKFADALQRDKARSLDTQLRRVMRKASWQTCFDANILSGDLAPSPVTITGVNNYFPNKGEFNDALQIRLTVSNMMAAADACPPFIVVPTNRQRTPIGFLAIYEYKDEAHGKVCHERQYAPAIINEVRKISPFLKGFARMRTSLVYDRNQLSTPLK